MLIDTHAHLDFSEFSANLSSVLQRAAQAGVSRIITIGIDLASSERAVTLAQAHQGVYATIGVHPHDAFAMDPAFSDRLKALCSRPKVVAVGETGLDFFRNYRPVPVQRDCFRTQLQLAVQVKLPVVFHIREAFDDFFEIVSPFVKELQGGVLHCFSGDWTVARRCLDMGFFLSVPGVVTYPKALALQDVVRKAPLDRLLVETDSPYLTPVPHRGKTNEPCHVLHTAKKMAQLRGISLKELALATTKNARTVFGLDEGEQS